MRSQRLLPTIETRKDSRIPLQLEATVTDGVIVTSAASVDVSRSGIALTSDLLWQSGSYVTVRLRLPNGKSAVARGLVRRTKANLMDLQLIAFGPSFSRLLVAQKPAQFIDRAAS